MAELSQDTLRAINKYGPSVNALARRRYHIGGRRLLGKLVLGESTDDMGAVSPAGARGKAQFMPGSRDVAIDRFGVDPWRSTDEAVHGAALHLRGKINGSRGLEGYNPGDPNYPSYILGQHVGQLGPRRPRPIASSAGGAGGGLPGGGTGLVDLLAQLQGGPARAPASAPAEPVFSARAGLALPKGYQVPASSGAPAAKPALSDLMRALPGAADGASALPGAADLLAGGVSSGAPVGAKDAAVEKIKAEAELIDDAQVPYKWGGGHGAKQPRGSTVTPLDCSGAVSRALGINPRVSGLLGGGGRGGAGSV